MVPARRAAPRRARASPPPRSTELREETGVVVDPADLEAFACLSEAELHTITYPGGDVTHCFAMLFLARRWTGDPRPDGVETTEMLWADPAAPPSPLEAPPPTPSTSTAPTCATGAFQVSLSVDAA